MTNIMWCLLVCIVGAALYLICAEGKLQAKVAHLAFWAFVLGLAATLIVEGAHLAKL